MLNNIFLQIDGVPGLNVPSVEDDLFADGNLLWGLHDGDAAAGDFFQAWRSSKAFEASKKKFAEGIGAHDIFANPAFASFDENPAAKVDVRLSPDSPAINRGVAVPSAWPDSLRGQDSGRPDIGAVPAGAAFSLE